MGVPKVPKMDDVIYEQSLKYFYFDWLTNFVFVLFVCDCLTQFHLKTSERIGHRLIYFGHDWYVCDCLTQFHLESFERIGYSLLWFGNLVVFYSFVIVKLNFAWQFLSTLVTDYSTLTVVDLFVIVLLHFSWKLPSTLVTA